MLALHSLEKIEFSFDGLVVTGTYMGLQETWEFAHKDILYIHSSKTEITIEFRGHMMDHRFTAILPNVK